MKTQFLSPLPSESQFASFSWPKYLFASPKGSLRQRLAKRRALGLPCCGPYRLDLALGKASAGFYLGEDSPLDLRWQWCDKVPETRIFHRGWFPDEHGEEDTIRGIVFRLPHGRGFLAGWSMGAGMASAVSYTIHATEQDAARAADRFAELTAEAERDQNTENSESP